MHVQFVANSLPVLRSVFGPIGMLVGVGIILAGLLLAGFTSPAYGKEPKSVTLLNVSYDPTRELYQEFNRAFAAHWKANTGQMVTIDQSHGGSGKQARAVIDGLEADVVTLSLGLDTEAIRRAGLIQKGWQRRLPHDSAPYSSTVVFLVRKGNPKNIQDWGDLVKGDIAIAAANPKTGGGARWNYLAAWGYVLKRELGDFAALQDPAKKVQVSKAQANAKAFVTNLYRRAPVLDSGARGATNTFVQRGIGDALICWENEAFLAEREFGKGQFEVVIPSLSVQAALPVAVVDHFAQRHGVESVATAYLEYLFSPVGQELVAKHHYRPSNPQGVSPALLRKFPKLELFTIEEAFGSWDQAQKEHFNDGGIFDQIYAPTR